MAVTRSTAAERRQREAAGGAGNISGIPGLQPGPGSVRNREGVLLVGALAAVLLGLFLAYLAMVKPLEPTQAGLASGAILNLNDLRQPEDLVPFLDFLTEPTERMFVARQIWRKTQEGPVPNVGELGRIRVPAPEIDKERRLPGLRERLAEMRASAPPDEGLSVRLLTTAQIRALKPHLIVRTPAKFRSTFWLWTGLMLAGFVAVHLYWRFRRFPGDELILPMLLVLTGIGLMVMVCVRDPLRDLTLYVTFVQGVLTGCVLLLAASQVDWERSPLRRMTYVPLLAALALSVLLITLGSGPAGSDAKVNLFGFQPVEAIKVLIVFFLAAYFFDRWEFLRELQERRLPGFLSRLGLPKMEYALPPVLAMGAVLMFFFLQRDLGPALVMAFLFLILYCVARGLPVMLIVGALVIGAGFFTGYQLGVPKTVTGRIQMWLSPWDNSFRGGDHLAQSLWSLAGGSVTGTGLGLGDPGQVPAAHTDMVLAAIGEELGFLGLLAVFVLYAALVWRGLRTARRAGTTYGFFLALGFAVLTALHILLIAGGVVGLLPLSGVVSPFLSFGRSAMLANFLLFGIVLALSARPGTPERHDRFVGAVRWTAIGLAVMGGAILLRAAQVQVLQANKFLTRGALTVQGDGLRRFQYNPRLEAIAETIPRGTVYDRNGLPLATSDPQELEKHKTDLAAIGAITDPGRPGRSERFYPFGGSMFHLLGDLRSRANWGASNSSYVERDSRIRLQGYDDFAELVEVKQPNGSVTEQVRRDYTDIVPLLRHRWQPEHKAVQKILNRKRDVQLTIDARLQARVAQIVRKYAREAGIKEGAAAVVLDPDTGDVLASVSYPWPDDQPVKATEKNEKALIDRARYGVYPPGSTFKLVTAMAALRKDPTVTQKTFQCVPLPGGRVGNRVRGWGKPIRDDVQDVTPHGDVNLEKGLVVSCNAYFAQLGTYEVGPEELLQTAQLLGITTARPNTAEQLKDALPQASYGQGQVIATPFKMARVAATVARGGTMPQGQWVGDDSEPKKGEPVEVLSSESTAFIARSMREVVTQGTAARLLGGMEPPVAGKTGTAEVQDKRSHSWFVGYAPYDREGGRRIAFAVIVEHGGYGGRLAAQASGEIIQAASALGLFNPEQQRENETAP
ncbi:MAG TPA: FtsW/RodA/SpoVE family cell cycle protein [Thermoanaerobaculia bacterium]|jgi:cell division protein FtsW (lipid II flippase)|nr:FtsW/RodA/SpoVE family cell cycle protein [Thermoanaerobaculia bacterium]